MPVPSSSTFRTVHVTELTTIASHSRARHVASAQTRAGRYFNTHTVADSGQSVIFIEYTVNR